MTSSIGEADVGCKQSRVCIRQTRKFITHTGCIFYSTLLICSAYKSAPVIRHTHHISFIHLTRFQTFQLLTTFHSQTHFIFQIPFIQAHIVVLIRHKSRPRFTFPAHCRCRNTKTKVTDMSINNTDRNYWQYSVFPHYIQECIRHAIWLYSWIIPTRVHVTMPDWYAI